MSREPPIDCRQHPGGARLRPNRAFGLIWGIEGRHFVRGRVRSYIRRDPGQRAVQGQRAIRGGEQCGGNGRPGATDDPGQRAT